MATSKVGGAALLAALTALSGCARVPVQPMRRAPTGGLRALRLTSLDGQVRSVGEVLAEGEATVFVFWSSVCPCVRRYQERVDALAAVVAGQGIRFVGVSSNAGESPEQVRRAVEERGTRLSVLRDEGGAVAAALEARTTPTVVLLRRDGTVLFHGWLDNERLPGQAGRSAWLEDAIAAFLAHRPGPSSSKTFGCTITRRLGDQVGVCHSPEVGPPLPGSPTVGGLP